MRVTRPLQCRVADARMLRRNSISVPATGLAPLMTNNAPPELTLQVSPSRSTALRRILTTRTGNATA